MRPLSAQRAVACLPASSGPCLAGRLPVAPGRCRAQGLRRWRFAQSRCANPARWRPRRPGCSGWRCAGIRVPCCLGRRARAFPCAPSAAVPCRPPTGSRTRSWPGWMHPAAPLRPSQSGRRGQIQRSRRQPRGRCPAPLRVRSHRRGCLAAPGGSTAAIPARAGPWPGCQRVPWPQCPGAGPGWLFRSTPGGWAQSQSRAGCGAQSPGRWPRQTVPPTARRCCARRCGLAAMPLVHCYRSWPGTVQLLPRSVLARCAPRPVPAARRGGRRCLAAHAPCHKKARLRAAMWGLLLPFVGPVRRARPGRGPRPAARAVERKRQTPATALPCEGWP